MRYFGAPAPLETMRPLGTSTSGKFTWSGITCTGAGRASRGSWREAPLASLRKRRNQFVAMEETFSQGGPLPRGAIKMSSRIMIVVGATGAGGRRAGVRRAGRGTRRGNRGLLPLLLLPLHNVC